MNKKGEITINYIILLIIGLVALIVILIIFSDQISDFVKTIRELIGGYGSAATDASRDLLPKTE
jgi:hypothetical protein